MSAHPEVIPTVDVDAMLLDEQLCFALYAATNAIQRLYRPLLAQFELTYAQFLILLVMWEHEELDVSAIGGHLGLNSATLSPALKRMEVAGLLLRTRSTVDERRVVIRLTERGRDLKPAIEAATESVRCAAAAGTPHVAQLVSALADLRQHLEACAETNPPHEES